MFKRKEGDKTVSLTALHQIGEIYAYLQERLGYSQEEVLAAGVEWAKKHKKKREVTQIQLLRELEKIINQRK